jgi:uncharacterized protein
MSSNYSSFIEVKASKISGKGVFASKKIQKGQTIYVLKGEEIDLDELIKRCNEYTESPSDPLQIEREKYIDLEEFSRSFNHSCNPNSFVKGKNKLVALRDIQKGEEITYDYSATMNDYEEKIVKAGRSLWTCKCNCKSKNCRGVIDQFRKLPKELQEFYLKNKLAAEHVMKAFEISPLS